jgi:hypothetical protein
MEYVASQKDISPENDWSIIDGSEGFKVPLDQTSKTIAERAAWDFIEREGKELELSVVDPVGVFGPLIEKDARTSNQITKKMLDRSVPGCHQA